MPKAPEQEYMMQQGGVSKATKTLNLSEDIFAGMDFVLRGGGGFVTPKKYPWVPYWVHIWVNYTDADILESLESDNDM